MNYGDRSAVVEFLSRGILTLERKRTEINYCFYVASILSEDAKLAILMSVRKYNRQSEGHYDKICLPNESEKYLSKSHQKAVYNDLLSSSKERSSPHSSHNGPSSKRLDYLSLHGKNNSKSSHSISSQKQRESDSPSIDRHGNSSSRHGKNYENIVNDDFEWTVHTSSSGKIYYYNKRTEKSQWEKPKEWIERESKLRSRDREREKEREKEREREKRIREISSRDSREQSKYAKLSPFKKEHLPNRGSSQSRRNHEYSEVERTKAVQTHGSSTSAVSTASSRSSGCPTPDTIGSPIGSVQDISPPSTPSNSGVSSLSPYVNSSTANSITSPHVFTSSPGVSSVVQSSHSTSTSYPNYYRYPGSDSKSVTGGSSLSSSQNSTYTGYPTPQNNSDVSAVKSPTPALHPLQQAMLLQQQQQQQMVQSMYVSMNQTPPPFVHEQKYRNETGPPPPPPQQPHSVATPPPPPPPNQLDGNSMTPVGYQSSRHRDPRSDRPEQRSDPRSSMGSKNTHGQSQELSYASGGLDNGSWENTRRETKSQETSLPELSDLTTYGQFCCRKAYEDVAGWMGSILERQAAVASIEVDSCLGLAGERSKSNSLLANMATFITESRHQVSISRTSCIREVLDQVEGLQDSRIERQDSRLDRQDSRQKRHDSDRTDTKSTLSDSKSDKKDLRIERKDLKTERKDSLS